MATDNDIVKDAQEAFKLASDSESDNRKEALDDIRFARLGEQWPEAIKRQREAEERPCLTINRMPSFIRQVVNDARQNKPSVKCHPVDDEGDVRTAEILNGLIRNIEVVSKADIAYDTAIDHAVSGGFGYFRVVTDYAHDDSFSMDILIKRVLNQFTVYGDPENNEAGDGSDWRRAFVTEWIKKSTFKRKWPKADEINWEQGASGDTQALWVRDEDVRVAEYWERSELERKIVLLSDGAVWDEKDYVARKHLFDMIGLKVVQDRMAPSWEVKQHWIGGNQLLETVDWAGIYIPIIPVYGDEVDVDGKRYYRSLIRDAKDPQRMLNYWRTTSTELVALAPKAPFIGPVGAFDTDADKWGQANTKTYPFLQYDGNIPPQRQLFAGPPAGALQEALNATDDIKSVIGIYDASLGARSNETSGRAILARQRESDTGTFHFIDNMNRAIRHCGRILVDLIPRVYDKPQVLRILGEDMKPQNVQVNQPIQQEDGTELIYDLANGKYDVTIETGPNFTTKREEFVNSITQLTQSNPNVFPLIGDMLAKNMDWPEADKVAARFQVMLPPEIKAMEEGQPQISQQVQQQMGQMQQAIQQLTQQNQQLQQQAQSGQTEAAKAQANAQSSAADLQVKQLDSHVKEVDAQVSMAELEIKKAELAVRSQELELKKLELMRSMSQPAACQNCGKMPCQCGNEEKEPAETE